MLVLKCLPDSTPDSYPDGPCRISDSNWLIDPGVVGNDPTTEFDVGTDEDSSCTMSCSISSDKVE